MEEKCFCHFGGYKVRDPEAMRSEKLNLIVSGANMDPNWFYEILKSYMDNTGKFYYGTPSFVGYDYNVETEEFTDKTITGRYDAEGNAQFPVVCATLVWLALCGVGFENCRMNTGEISENEVDGVLVPQISGGENIPYSGKMLINGKNPTIIPYWQHSGHGSVYSHQIAKLLDDCGMLHDITTETFSELAPGDLLFYANYKEGSQTTVPFKNIGHVEIFLGWTGNEILTITTDNSGVRDTIRYIKYNRRPAKETDMINYLKYYARIPVPANGIVSKIAHSEDLTISKGTSSLLQSEKPLERNRAYTMVIKVKSTTGDLPRFNLYPANDGVADTSCGFCTSVLMENKGAMIAPGTYYNTIVIPKDLAYDPEQLRLFYATDSAEGTAEVEEVYIFDKLVQAG